ncbi:MAG: LTA synthase family protein [Bacteroidia bacterium]|nr:LTA synthase family protein [Bacteroidia bacterium]
MKQYLKIFIISFLFWLVYFIFARLLFLCYELPQSGQYNLFTLLLTEYHGLRLDLSVTGYIMVIPTLLLAASQFFNRRYLKIILSVYTIFILIILTIVIVADLELYRNWGYRMDNTPLLYLRTPGEAMASVKWQTIFLLVSIMTAIIIAFSFIFTRITGKIILKLPEGNWKRSLVFIMLTCLLFIPIRGSFSLATVNTGMVYFHKDNYPNQAAVNVIFNVIYSLTEIKKQPEYHYMEESKAEEMLRLIHTDKYKTDKVLKTSRPNIVIILLESFTYNIIGSLGGRSDITPNFNRLSKEGILFSNFYASGDRSDKGIVAILSGFPAQPATSIINFPEKTQRLPFLSRELEKDGYNTAFYYGGEINFANMNSFFVNGGFDKIVSKKDFNPVYYNSKWGVHDQYLFDRVLKEMNAAKEPFFDAMFTLSSHEPFDVPVKTVIPGEDEESKFLNAACYTDQCLGNFIENAKKQAWWNNTLIILVADHGHRLPGNTLYYADRKFHIPMLWLGGALAVHDTIISTVGSQTDIPLTVLDQLGVKHDDFMFSKDLLSNDPYPCAFYCFNNGFGFIRSNGLMIFDNTSGKCKLQNGMSNEDILTGQAFMQVVGHEFNE